jgi:hypothetical protein
MAALMSVPVEEYLPTTYELDREYPAYEAGFEGTCRTAPIPPNLTELTVMVE